MKADEYYSRMIEAVQREPQARHDDFCRLHDAILGEYLDAVRGLSPEDAARPGSDGRSIAQVVAHIAEWDRYLILAAGELLAGVDWPQMMRFSGYLDNSGAARSFASIDEFNAYQAEKYSGAAWEQIQSIAVEAALAFHALVTHRHLLSAAALEKGRPYNWKLPDGQVVSVPIGWFLWHINLEHEGVDHAADLGMA